jgi:hypothetical protein
VCNPTQTPAYLFHYRLIMRKLLQTLAISAMILGSASGARAQINIGIHLGEPPPPRSYRVPARPGPDYIWVEGYQYPQGSHYAWHNGYWTRAPYQGAYWVAPYHTNGQYYTGRWEGSRGNLAHDHRWDKGKQRDERREPHSNDRR